MSQNSGAKLTHMGRSRGSGKRRVETLEKGKLCAGLAVIGGTKKGRKERLLRKVRPTEHNKRSREERQRKVIERCRLPE